jgi:hypothetical protein
MPQEGFQPSTPEPQYLTNERGYILGTWISDADPNYRMVFEGSGFCYIYYGQELLSTNGYELSNTSPKCGYPVNIDESELTSYLQLTDMNDGMQLCYSIFGLSSGDLSIMPVGGGGLLTYTKQ